MDFSLQESIWWQYLHACIFKVNHDFPELYHVNNYVFFLYKQIHFSLELDNVQGRRRGGRGLGGASAPPPTFLLE